MGIIVFQGSVDDVFGYMNLLTNMGEGTMTLPVISPIPTEGPIELSVCSPLRNEEEIGHRAPEIEQLEEGVGVEMEVGKESAVDVVTGVEDEALDGSEKVLVDRVAMTRYIDRCGGELLEQPRTLKMGYTALKPLAFKDAERLAAQPTMSVIEQAHADALRVRGARISLYRSGTCILFGI